MYSYILKIIIQILNKSITIFREKGSEWKAKSYKILLLEEYFYNVSSFVQCYEKFQKSGK